MCTQQLERDGYGTVRDPGPGGRARRESGVSPARPSLVSGSRIRLELRLRASPRPRLEGQATTHHSRPSRSISPSPNRGSVSLAERKCYRTRIDTHVRTDPWLQRLLGRTGNNPSGADLMLDRAHLPL